jgi:DNA-binding NarL/FixJ family response regulator
VLSQDAEAAYARELLTTGGGTGYLIKDRISRPREFIEALVTVATGGTVLDPEVVSQMFTRDHARQALESLTEREDEHEHEHDVLKQMAEGLSNVAISAALFITKATVEKHVNNIFAKLGLSPCSEDHRRVRAVLTYLNQ